MVVLAFFVLFSGCAQLRPQADGTYTTMLQAPIENAEKAKRLNSKALAEMQKGNIEKSERFLKDALVADVNYAPAHNNLGQIYLRRHQLYLAAWEFEFAANLMPERAEPYMNLGLLYETAGQLRTAQEYYLQAHDISPQDSQIIGCLARVFVKLGDDPDQTAFYLQQVLMHEDNGNWSKWAKHLLETKYLANRNQLDLPIFPDEQPYPFEPIETFNTLPIPVDPAGKTSNSVDATQMRQQTPIDLEWIPAVEQSAPVIKANDMQLEDK